MPDFQLKPIPEDDIVYWWNVLEGRKLVTVKEYQFDPRVAMFTEENLPEPIQVLQKGGPAPDSEPGRYTLWINENRVCVGLQAGTMILQRKQLWE